MITAGEFLQAYKTTAKRKTENTGGRLFILAVLAGFLICMGAMTSTILTYRIENPSLAGLIKGLVFPFGLILVIYTGAELFTGNVLLCLSCFDRTISIKKMLRNWCWVYFGNFAAALLLAFSHIMTGGFNPDKTDLAITMMETADHKCSLHFGQAFVLGIFCNILVCLAVMCALMAKSGPGKALASYLPVAFFVWAGFEHSIANMYYISSGIFLKTLSVTGNEILALGSNFSNLTWSNFFLKNLIPVTLGNILGGFLYAGLIYLAYRPQEGK